MKGKFACYVVEYVVVNNNVVVMHHVIMYHVGVSCGFTDACVFCSPCGNDNQLNTKSASTLTVKVRRRAHVTLPDTDYMFVSSVSAFTPVIAGW